MRRFISYSLRFVLLCGFTAGSAIAGNSHTLKQIPKPNFLEGPCVLMQTDGSAEFTLINSPGITCQTNTWYYSTYHVTTTSFPNQSVTLGWYAYQPSGSSICGRIFTYDTNGSPGNMSNWKCGGGFKSTAVSTPSSLGRVALQIAMSSSSSSIKPKLRTMTAQIYVP